MHLDAFAVMPLSFLTPLKRTCNNAAAGATCQEQLSSYVIVKRLGCGDDRFLYLMIRRCDQPRPLRSVNELSSTENCGDVGLLFHGQPNRRAQTS